ncbi:polysaccharide deacetylase family protein [Hymenobacter jejuensis]|uniref:Polysaccharide deacetylase family protein n=1 Tax=Hymenobacter jejuensis TaxID=2502781 RepID=A0A5B7ZWB0_9BACT|nr:polysaccharide deacetylase family protein [Hymenobacter jejuensis]QDA59444.1 polysaccharide deacetylase family protein [Hymenobacter jejuensis]
MKRGCLFVLCWLAAMVAGAQIVRQPIPDKLVVLTFDDGPVTHAAFVAPLLKKYGFGGTFFVCEFPPNFADKTKYMSWQQIRQLDRMGFEVANHTLTHKHVNKLTKPQLVAELDSLEKRCQTYQIPRPVTFAYPGYDTAPTAFEVLKEKGYLFARAGYDRAYNPLVDHPYLVPGFTMKTDNKALIMNALQQAKNGKIVVLTVHGIPDYEHDWVTTQPALFEEYMKYLHDNHYRVIALRDLAKYINVSEAAQKLSLTIPKSAQ